MEDGEVAPGRQSRRGGQPLERCGDGNQLTVDRARKLLGQLLGGGAIPGALRTRELREDHQREQRQRRQDGGNEQEQPRARRRCRLSNEPQRHAWTSTSP